MKKAFTLIELLIVVAIIAILAAIAVPNFLEAQTRAKIARVLSDQRTYATALETYQIDNSTYPLHYPFTAAAGYVAPAGVSESYNSAIAALQNPVPSPNPYTTLPSFAKKNAAGTVPPISLTTPVSYLNTYVPDTFGQIKQATFSYASGPAGFLIWSPGPDTKDQLDQGKSAESFVRGSQSLPSSFLITGPTVGTAPTGGAGTPSGSESYTYDATNGTASTGDTYRTK